MIKGVITCSCGQLFGFETTEDKVKCPTCANVFVAEDHVTIEPEIEEEPESEPEI